jgi:hypothetical protein
MTEWQTLNLLHADYHNEYPSFGALIENLQDTDIQPGWNIDEGITTLVCQLSEHNWTVTIWHTADVRQRLRDLLDLGLNILHAN